jgi:prophage tail gpP-like protein
MITTINQSFRVINPRTPREHLAADGDSLALKMGGQIVIVPSKRMPTTTGIAAIHQ